MPEVDAHARRLGRTALFGRLMGAHFLSYPLMFVGAAGGMSLSIVLQKQALLVAGLTRAPNGRVQAWLVDRVSLTAGDAAVFEMVITPVMWVLGAIFVLSHAVSVPWALAARRKARGEGDAEAVKKARKLWIIVSLGGTGVVLLGGLVGWAIILFSA